MSNDERSSKTINWGIIGPGNIADKFVSGLSAVSAMPVVTPWPAAAKNAAPPLLNAMEQKKSTNPMKTYALILRSTSSMSRPPT